MKLINQSFEILEQKDFSIIGIKKFIEKCYNICYEISEEITDNSYEYFINNLIKKEYTKPLELGTVHLKLSISALEIFEETVVTSRMFNHSEIHWDIKESLEDNEYYAYITTNYRYYLALLNEAPWLSKYLDSNDNEFYPKRYTVHFIISREIMDEFRTSVGLSSLAKSTMYCSYSKDKFDNQVTFIIPNWTNIKEGEYDEHQYSNDNYYTDYTPDYSYMINLFEAESTYFRLLKNGWKPQQAIQVLPLSVKSELISCSFEDDWSNFFCLRYSNNVSSMAKEIVILLRKKFKELGYVNK